MEFVHPESPKIPMLTSAKPAAPFDTLEEHLHLWNQQGNPVEPSVERTVKEYERLGKEADQAIKEKQARDRERRK